MGEVDGEFVVNPSWTQLVNSRLNLVVACSEHKVGKEQVPSFHRFMAGKKALGGQTSLLFTSTRGQGPGHQEQCQNYFKEKCQTLGQDATCCLLELPFWNHFVYLYLRLGTVIVG